MINQSSYMYRTGGVYQLEIYCTGFRVVFSSSIIIKKPPLLVINIHWQYWLMMRHKSIFLTQTSVAARQDGHLWGSLAIVFISLPFVISPYPTSGCKRKIMRCLGPTSKKKDISKTKNIHKPVQAYWYIFLLS